MRTRLIAIAGAAALVVTLCSGGVGASAGPYSKIGEIPIGGPAGFDYLNVDPVAKRLYVTNGAQVVVIDLATNTVAGKIAAGPGVHGIALAPGGERGFISNGGDDTVSIVDLKTFQTIKKVSTKGPDPSVRQNPDAIMYEPKNNEVYAFNHSGKTATVINATTGDVVASMQLAGTAETGQADPALNRVFVNIEDNATVDVIDMTQHKVVANWSVKPAESPTGMAIDTATHRLFIGGGPNTVMMDATNGKVVASIPICSGTDATWFDPATKYVFSSCGGGSGAITIAHMDSPSALTVVQTLETVARARTMALDTATHNIYVVGQKYPPADPNAPPPPAGQRGRGPAAIPDSFHVEIFGMSK